MSLLEVAGLNVFYGDFQALYDVDLTVDEGETLAIIGANGAGKSTCLNTIAGLLPASKGSVTFRGASVDHLPAYRRVLLGVTLVPEGRRLFPTLTVEENLKIGSWGQRKGPWTVRRVYEVFPLLRSLSGRPAALLSGGEQQQVAIGRALMSNPHLLLMDEISLGLAPIVVKQLYEAIPAIAADGTTLLIVEQDVTQALKVADRVLCFLAGRISLQGSPIQLAREDIRAAYFGF